MEGIGKFLIVFQQIRKNWFQRVIKYLNNVLPLLENYEYLSSREQLSNTREDKTHILCKYC